MEFYTFNYNLTRNFLNTLEQTEVEFNIHLISNKQGVLKADLSDEKFFKICSKKKIIDDISQAMTQQDIGIFSFFNKAPSLVEKINMTINEYETENDQERYTVVLPLAPILGLPCIEEPKIELAQLKDLFLFLKQEQLDNPTNKIKLSIHRGFGKTGIEVICENQALKEKLNNQFDEKINASPILTAWRNNLLSGIKQTSKKCSNLFYNNSLSFLFNQQELSDFYKKQELEEKKDKYQQQVDKIKQKNKSFF